MATAQVSWRDLRPHWAWYFTVPAVVLLGVVVAVVLFVLTLVSLFDELEPFTGSTTVTLEEGEVRGLYREQGFGPCTVTGPGETRVAQRGVSASFEITEGSRSYEAFSQFTAPADGDYRVSCTGFGGTAVGPEPDVFGLIGSIFGVFVGIFGGLLLGLGLWILIFVLRLRDRRRRQRGPPGMPPPAAPPPPPGFMNA